jgi:uncharacterized YigZ family protein
VKNSVEAEKKIAEIRGEFHDAAHNCFAYRLDQYEFRYSDDREPTGTAGLPILAKIDKFQLRKVVLVVSRYFGGVKLGTGGLKRAYGECAEELIEKAEIVKNYKYKVLRLTYPFEMVSAIHKLAYHHRARIDEFANAAGMSAKVYLLPSRVDAFHEDLLEKGAGKIKIKNEE